ncbi:5041_t:CDS:2 [Ambispora leptoticha]|uniref:5041_t:CDS:1 n=1 Tax=Ambispora leptoticha TaxID=144679 RepID=A0A9N8VGD8_9GLOM|nr:5041_t:CDS:2 [Ambispora leptoticha]
MQVGAKHQIFFSSNPHLASNNLYLKARLLSDPDSEVTVEEEMELTKKKAILWKYDESGRIISEYKKNKALAVKDLSEIVLEPVEVAPSWFYNANTLVFSCLGYNGALTVKKGEDDQYYLRLEPYDNNNETQRFRVRVVHSANI